MKKAKIFAAVLMIAALSGCSEPAQDTAEVSGSAVTSDSSETASEEAVIPEESSSVAGTSYICENIGATFDEVTEKYGSSPEYHTLADPPRFSMNFGDGVIYAAATDEYDTRRCIRELIFNDADAYPDDILPNLKLGMSFEDIKKIYPLTTPDTGNLNGTYCSYFNTEFGGKQLEVTVDFGNDESCSSAGYIRIADLSQFLN